MTFTQQFTSKFAKSLKNFEKIDQDRIKKTCKSIIEEPYRGKKLQGNLGWRERIGNIRIIYQIDKQNELIKFLDCGFRRNIYK